MESIKTWEFLKSRTLTGLISLFCFATANAQTPDAMPIDPKGSWAFTVSVEQVSFDEEQAASPEALIDDSAPALNFEAEYFFHQHYSTSFGLSLISYDDHASFTQRTEDNFGDRDTSKSDAIGIPVYGELGYKRFLGPQGKTYVTARAGYSVMLSSERSISNCSNCYEEDIEIDGGAYAALGAGIKLGTSWLLGVQYKNYFSGDFTRSAGVNLSYMYF